VPEQTEIVIVGGSVAGLQTALTLGRARRSVVVVDDGHPRNGPARQVHNFLGQSAPTPAGLLATGRELLRPYDVTIVRDRVEEVRRNGRALEVRLGGGAEWGARAVVLATGLHDVLPDVPGVAAAWGGSVVACPHCHGWEVRDGPLAQLGLRGLPARGVARALLLSAWSEDVVLFTDGDPLAAADVDRLARAGVRVRTERVLGVEEVPGGVEVVVAGGERVPRRALFVATTQHQQTDLAVRLGCALVPDGPAAGAVAADTVGRTGVPGVWVAGTTANPALLAIGAAGHGSTVATALHADLLEQDHPGR
jgi:thioredoxin reductase (NADPH)